MLSLKTLSELMCQRLNSVAEEIFSVFEKIVADCEEEVNRQRRLLDIVCQPELQLQRIEVYPEAAMLSLKTLRELMCQRLNSVAEEIFSVFEKIVADYEEEVNRQRRLLDIVCQPELQLQRIELVQQHVFEEEDVDPNDLQLCNQERSSSLDQEEPELFHIKKEQEGIEADHEGERSVLMPETDSSMLPPVNEESDPEPASEQQPLSDSPVAQSQDQTESEHVAIEHAESSPQKRRHTKKNWSKSKSHSHTKKKRFKCDTCEKSFGYKSHLKTHMRVHTGEKPHVCKLCGKGCSRKYTLKQHMLTHRELKQQHVFAEEDVDPTDLQLCNQERSSSLDQEEPESLQIQEEQEGIETDHEGEPSVLMPETDSSMLPPVNEESDHSDPEAASKQQPLSDSPAAQSQDQTESEHVAIEHAESSPQKRGHTKDWSKSKSDSHTKKKRLKCDTCGKPFEFKSHLQIHLRVHTGEKPYVCKRCGRGCVTKYTLKKHMLTHGEEDVDPTDLQLCNQERSSSLEPQALQIPGGQERIDTDREGEPSVLQQETVSAESDHCEPEPDSDQQPLSDCSSVSESEESTAQRRRGSKKKSPSNNVHNPDLTKGESDTGTKQTSYICKVCGKSFKFLCYYTTHQRVHTGEKPYACKLCGKGLSTPFSRARHMRIHKGDKNYSYMPPAPKRKSDKAPKEKRLRCGSCGKLFRYESHLNIHQRRHTGEKPFVCAICRRRFRTESVLKRHLLLHRDEKPFPWNTYLSEITSDTQPGEKSFKCDNCENNYSSPKDVKMIRKNYSKEKKYACIPCFHYLKFRKQSKLKKATDTPKEPHICQVCGRKIATKSALTVHMRTHTSEKLFCCDICGKRYNWQTSLDIHLRSHTKEKAFFCHICGKSYTQYTGWKIHMRRHGDSDTE